VSINAAGIDAGGPRRDYFTGTAAELRDKLKLFIKSPNGVHNVGDERDKWVPNPMATSLTDSDNFFKLGIFIAFSLKMRECIELDLPTIFWKYLFGSIRVTEGNGLVWDDIKAININLHVCLEKIESMPDSDLEYLDERFVTFLSDGSSYELLANGKDLLVTPQNKARYIQLCKQVHLAQIERPFSMIKKGFNAMVPQCYIDMFTAEELEKEICGSNFVGRLLIAGGH
jgi:E3 ubiquitin-protein ligase HERC2